MSTSARTAASVRLGFIDNIRWVMIVLVLSMHSADTYSPFGNWYFTEHPHIGTASALFFATYQSFLQAFFMGLLFFVAGYFTPGSLARKGPRRFITDRAMRLGAPTLLYMVAIGPLTEYYVSHSWHTADSFPRAWFEYVARGQILSGTGPMWFCAPLRNSVGLLANSALALGIAILAICTFGVRLVIPSGVAVLNLQLADFPQYVFMFGAGIAASGADWLLRLDARWEARWCAGTLAVGAILWASLILFGGALHGQMAAYSSGWHWQDFGTSLWSAFICVGMSIGTLVAFRAWMPTQDAFARFMSDNAFAVYVFHPPVLIALAILFRPIHAPAIVKFALLLIAVTPVMFVLSQRVIRRVPGLRQIM